MTCRIFSTLLMSFIFFNTYAVTIKLCYPDNDAPPWQIGNGENIFHPPGLSIDIITAAAKKIKADINIIRVPTNRVFQLLAKGEVDGVFIFSFLPERQESGVYPLLKNGELNHKNRVASLDYHFYKNKKSKLTWDGKTLSNLNSEIGVNRGYAVIDILKKLSIPYEESKGSEILVKKVDSGRLDGLVSQSMTVDLFIRKLKAKNLIKLSPPVISKDYFLVFGKSFYEKNKILCEKFWDSIGNLRDLVIKKNIVKYAN
ncbi:transporter substrate-binding domain-containing protein [Pigmentibacter sp. JX0631]|uniref:substrate-binding periplasmic protein n=1 Tax=Pigmentibacter sp. JX0631 TaxID=2976982 RepID=UPI002468D36D|nr:transporter substrate-binding domain-containing protein [Pigmentibacter sp. JX0631]WGL59820.1 transporter substrate-binding domain-containing protein [Pigmentibacter sp. JX0631]